MRILRDDPVPPAELTVPSIFNAMAGDHLGHPECRNRVFTFEKIHGWMDLGAAVLHTAGW